MKRCCVHVGAHYIRWSNWYWRWIYTDFRHADRFDLAAAVQVAQEVTGQIVPG